MDNNELIPTISDDISENSVLVVKRKKKRKKHFFFKRLLCFVLIMGLCYFVYRNLNEIKVMANKIVDKFSSGNNNEPSFDSSIIDSDSLSSDSGVVSPPEDIFTIPSDAFEIISNTGNFTEISNEAEISLDFDYSNSHILANDIYKQYGNEAPVVLIIHSSCREAYSNGSYYYTDDSFYSNENNISLVGKIICDTLNDNNINTIHIDDIFANGSIYNSNVEFEKALNQALKMYPSISYVFDVSRDIIINDDLSMNKMVSNINGKDIAQIKLIIGSSSDENKTFWHKNLSFASKLAENNSDLIYDVTLSKFELTQNISPISMRIDVGAFSNSIDEAILAGNELALRICNLLSQGW